MCIQVFLIPPHPLPRLFPMHPQEWLLQALGALDVKVADNFQKQELMEKLFGAQADKGRKSFDDAVARFTSACFQNQRSWAGPLD